MQSAAASEESLINPVPPVVSTLDSSRGIALGLLAAVSYSIANLALRQLVTVDGGLAWDVWVSGVKAFPTAVIAGWLLLQRYRAGQSVLPDWNLLWPLVLTALVMQFGGNVGFQLSLRAIGLAISVPIVFSSIILSGAVVGRVALGDVVTVRTAVSMALMVISIGFLSAAAQTTGSPGSSSSWIPGGVAAGVMIALISGLSYGLCGVVIRRVVRGSQPVASTLFIFSITGLVTLCPLSGAGLGWDGLSAIALSDWWIMLAAGTFNASGFFAITHALKLLTISRANVINASQNAFCAIGAVLLFAEPLTSLAIVGIGLTIAGLLTLDRR